MKQLVDRNKIVIRVMDQSSTDSGGQPPPEGAEVVQNTAGTMTYANLETLTRLNHEELSTILSTGGHQRDHGSTHYADASAAGDEPSGYIVTMATEASTAEAYALAEQTGYVVATTSGAPTAETSSGVEEAAPQNDSPTLDPQLTGHSYCKPTMRVHGSGSESIAAAGTGEEVDGAVETAVRGGMTATLGDAVVTRHSDLLDLKTVLPSSTTRRLLLIDDGHGDLEMAKSDVEFLLRGDAASIVLREGKRSEVWSRFGKVTFQNRKVKGYVACIFCRQVYAFGDAHSTGTSTLKKHRCIAQSITTTSPMTPTPALASPSPAPSVSQESSAYVNFPSPSVIVSISTMRTADAGDTPLVTRFLSSSERDDVIRAAAMTIACPVAGIFNAARTVAELGARHGTQVVEDLAVILKTPQLHDTILPSLASEYRSHFVEEARTSGCGIGLVLEVSYAEEKSAQLTLKLSYTAGLATSSPHVRQVPLRHATLLRDSDLGRNAALFVRRALKEEKLDHLRRAVLSNCPDVLEKAFHGEMVAHCVTSAMSTALNELRNITQHDWSSLVENVQKIASTVQIIGPETSIAKTIRPGHGGLELMRLIANFGSQFNEIHKFWQDQRQDSTVIGKIDRTLVSQLAGLFINVQSILSKFTDARSEPSLLSTVLLRSSISALCSPKPADIPAVLYVKGVVRSAVRSALRVESIHIVGCLLHPAFKQMKKLDVSDTEKAEALAAVRNLIRQDSGTGDIILRSTLEGGKNGDGKRKNAKNDSTPVAKKQRTVCGSVAGTSGLAAPAHQETDSSFDWSDWADFNASAADSSAILPEKSELDTYLEEKLTPEDLADLNNVLVYWKNRRYIFPNLSRLACWIFALPASIERSTASKDIAHLVLQSVAQSSTVTAAPVE